MHCTRAALILAALLVGCASAKYRIERERRSCDDANEQVHRTLANLGYEITRFDPARAVVNGEIEAQRQTPGGLRRGRVRIECTGKTVFQPVEGAWFLPTYDFSRDVYYGLLATVDQPLQQEIPAADSGQETTGEPGPPLVRGKRPEGELRVIFRALGRFEVRRETGVDLVPRGLLVVRVAVVNRTTRAYVLPTDGIVLVDEAGERVRWLTSAEIASRIEQSTVAVEGPDERPLPPIDIPAAVSAMEEKVLTGGRIASGQTRSGLLCFPAGDYSSGRMRLIDEETGEVEGTIVAF